MKDYSYIHQRLLVGLIYPSAKLEMERSQTDQKADFLAISGLADLAG